MNPLRIAIAYCEQGSGHHNRQTVFADQLRQEGHDVLVVNDHLKLFDWFASYDGRVMKRAETIAKNIAGFAQDFAPGVLATRELLKEFGAEYGVVDFQPTFTFAARSLGIPLVSFDHQHTLTHLNVRLPRVRFKEIAARGLIPNLHSEHYIIANFFPAKPLFRFEEKTTVVGPVLRNDVLEAETENGEHMVFYATRPHACESLEALAKATDREVYFFNSGRDEGRKRNIQYMPADKRIFSKILASAAGLVSNAGNNAAGEALYHETPIFGLPLDLFEQEVNALNIRERGYGNAALGKDDAQQAFGEFLERLAEYRANIREDGDFFNGNTQLMPAFRQAVRNIERRKEEPRQYSTGQVQPQLI